MAAPAPRGRAWSAEFGPPGVRVSAIIASAFYRYTDSNVLTGWDTALLKAIEDTP
ncbi:MAG TPA: hypothetical protein VFS43_04025 [Polyangiaceae bacterium]|nr:hypothetical protein [Polyangiaceae bacterium]